jgi:hypothetical protein
MKVTVLEYEEDPSIPKGKNSTDDDEGEADYERSSSSREQQPVCEYTLQVEEVASNNINGRNSKMIMGNRRVTKMTKKKMIPIGGIFRSPVKVLRKLFLPLGYPHSVGSTYLPYQMYDGLQGLW